MIESSTPSRFKVDSGGARALALLRAESPCRVAAVFKRSFYLQSKGAMACLGAPEIGAGPLNALIAAPRGMNWLASGLRVGTRCRRGTDTLYLGERFVLSTRGAALWRPDPAPISPDPVAVTRALRHLGLACAECAPAEGLARLVLLGRAPTRRTGIEALASAPMAASRLWLETVFGGAGMDQDGNDLSWVEALAGLGPGLTPSGDDYLGGLMIALHALGRAGPARRLAEAAGRAVSANGNAISAAHIMAAGDAQCHAAIHEILHGLLYGNDTMLCANLAAIGRIGHGSGWDTLAGMVTALRAWRSQKNRRQAA